MAEGIRARNVHHAYAGGRTALAGIDLDLSEDSFAAIIGPNGSGKSTLLRVLAGLLQPDEGSVEAAGLDLRRVRHKERARRIAWLPQSENEEIPFTALELVLMGRFPYQGFLPFDRERDLEVARRCLREMEAEALAGRRLAEMSGGERQRVHLARALAQEPRLLLLDEPAAALDLHFQVEVYRLLRRLNREQGRMVVMVSHDLNLPAAHADTVVLLDRGRVAALGAPDEVLRKEILEPVYRTRLIEARIPGTGRRFILPES